MHRRGPQTNHSYLGPWIRTTDDAPLARPGKYSTVHVSAVHSLVSALAHTRTATATRANAMRLTLSLASPHARRLETPACHAGLLLSFSFFRTGTRVDAWVLNQLTSPVTPPAVPSNPGSLRWPSTSLSHHHVPFPSRTHTHLRFPAASHYRPPAAIYPSSARGSQLQ